MNGYAFETRIDPVIRRLYDGLISTPRFAQWRDELHPYDHRLAEPELDPAETTHREFVCADRIVRTLTPMALGYWSRLAPRSSALGDSRTAATQLRECAQIVNSKTAKLAHHVARTAADEARRIARGQQDGFYASAAACTVNTTQNAVLATSHDRSGNGNAGAYAADASIAAASIAFYAAEGQLLSPQSTNAFSRSIWEETLDLLERLIRIRPAM